MTPSRRSTDQLLPTVKRRLKAVLRPAAGRAMPTVARIAGASDPDDVVRDVGSFVSGYRALESQFPEGDSPGNGTGDTPPTAAAVKKKVDAARAVRARVVNGERVARGASLGEGALDEVRRLVREGKRAQAVALGHALHGRPDTRQLGAAVLGAALLNSSGPVNAWAVFEEIVGTPVAQPVANELYAAAFGTLGAAAAPFLDADIEAGRISQWSAAALLRVAQKAYARGLTDQAAVLIRTAQELPPKASTANVKKELARLATWLPGGPKGAEIPQVEGAINYGVIGYDQPDIASRNIGDYIQTVASLGHVVRQRNFTLAGDAEIVEVAEELRRSTKTERFVDGPSATLNLFELNRDGSPMQAVPEGTWAVTFGWFMHHLFGQGYALPFHDNLRPIMISVFVRFPDMLTPEAIAYLTKYGPVGCRDWQSVALLRAVGVPAFFSGCMTTTVDTVFRRDGEDTRDATIYVDSPQTGPGDSRTQVQTGIRDLTFAQNLRLARDWVSHYHLEYDKVVTSRLHCFLPSRSVGSTVTFLPKNRSDNRFGGLIDTTDADFDRIRQGILDKVRTVLETIASGASEDEVYATWREITAPAMAEADELFASKHLRVLEPAQVEDLVAADGAASGEAIQVVVDARKGELTHLPRLVRSIAAHTSSPVEVNVVAANSSDADWRELLSQDLPVTVRRLPVDEAAIATLTAGLKPAARHELTLAVAAEALRSVDRAVVLPAAALVREDLARLADQAPTDGHLVTATGDRHRGRGSGLAMIRRVSSQQGDDNVKALDFLLAAHQLHDGEFATLDTNVMVLDLAAARAANLGGRLVPLVLDYGMTFREALSLVVGPERTDLDRVWNHAPEYEVQDAPAVVNWRDSSKPWSTWVTPFAAEWRAL